MNRKIVITGGSGFIGTNVLQYLIDMQYEVYNFDLAEPKNKEHMKYWLKVDITDFQELKENLRKVNPSYIIHLAARTDLDGNCIEDYSANTVGVTNLVKTIKLLSNIKKVVFTSSMLVEELGYAARNENDYHPSTFYGESKVMTEQIVKSGQLDCEWVIVRPTSIWGPWFGVPYRDFFDTIIRKRYVHIGNRGATMTYGYVGNAVYQICSLLFTTTSADENKVYYIGDYEPTNLEKWSNEIADSLGIKIYKIPYWSIRCAAWFGDFLKIFHVQFPMTTFRLHNMTTDNICDLKNVQSVFPTLPYSRKEGIEITLDWMRKEADRKCSSL